MKKHLYEPIWKRNLPLITNRLGSIEETIQMTKDEFEEVGNRVKSKYRFNLEFLNGLIYNNISGTAVARDLARVALADSLFNQKIKGKHIKINMDRDFLLYIKIL